MSMIDVYGKPVRIRLFFEEPGMLSKAQVDQGLAKSWYLVNADALSIGQLGARIEHDYRLGGSCPQGLVLEMRGFVLPPGQSARILQDSDLVRVRRKHERISRVQSRELLTNSLSVENEEIDHGYQIGRGGILAIEEFEKEAGGYQGELSDDGDTEFSLSSGKKMQSAVNEGKRLRAKESGKKRKRSLHIESHTQNDLLVPPPKPRSVPEGIGPEPSKFKKQKSSGKKKHDKVARGDLGSGQIMALEGLPRSEPIDEGVTAKIEKKKKKKNREFDEQTGPVVNSADASPPKEANAQEATPGKRRKVKSVKETEDPRKLAEIESGSQKLNPESSRKGEKSKRRQDKNHDNNEMQLLKEKSSEVKANNGSLLNNENAPKQADSAEKRPSRSARRKKAKRRWRRENLQNGIVPKKDDVKAQQTEPTDRRDTSESETSDDESESEAEAEAEAEAGAGARAEAEVEAEEEILPRMCAPGHIRFENVEDAGDEGLCAAPVLLSYTEVRCKKQGQTWGQEKSRGRYSGDSHNRNDKMENRPLEGTMEQSPSVGVVANKIEFEKLPLLNRIPSVGDLLAYQLVELTASWTPELSSYRVGKVSMYDGVSKMITLAPVPEYPIHAQQAEDEDGSLNENEFLPPYTPDGTLEVWGNDALNARSKGFDFLLRIVEVNLATLMEVRVVEEGPVQVNPHSQESPDVNATTFDVPIKSPQPATLLCTAPQEPVEPSVSVQLNSASNAGHTQSDCAEFRAGVGNGGEVGRSSSAQPEPVLDQPKDAGWQDMLSQEINNKKLELSLKAGKELDGPNCDIVPGPAPADGAKKLSNQVTPVENGKRNPRVSGAPIIRHRYMRTGALGPTMALLRANQIL